MLFTLIKERRTRRLTQAQLASMAKIHPVTLCRIEMGHQTPEPATREALAVALSVSADELFPELAAKESAA
jgi:transcriptional regulator with XRE-family HTH domain